MLLDGGPAELSKPASTRWALVAGRSGRPRPGLVVFVRMVQSSRRSICQVPDHKSTVAEPDWTAKISIGSRP